MHKHLATLGSHVAVLFRCPGDEVETKEDDSRVFDDDDDDPENRYSENGLEI